MSNDKIIKPRPLSGFPEWLPPEKLVEERVLSTIRQEFQRFGFTPIETPAVERKDVLEAKGMEQREIYALSRLAAAEGEDPSTEMALHFDLTVPLARYVAQHMNDLTFPLRRYQIQKVWRG
ncbi:MAG: ATP phosphoribosyltransferase regulatory subunit, partial [Pseudomonadota bacterium]